MEPEGTLTRAPLKPPRAGAIAGILMVYGTTPGRPIESGVYPFGRTVTYQIINVFAIKMAGVFMITTCRKPGSF